MDIEKKHRRRIPPKEVDELIDQLERIEKGQVEFSFSQELNPRKRMDKRNNLIHRFQAEQRDTQLDSYFLYEPDEEEYGWGFMAWYKIEPVELFTLKVTKLKNPCATTPQMNYVRGYKFPTVFEWQEEKAKAFQIWLRQRPESHYKIVAAGTAYRKLTSKDIVVYPPGELPSKEELQLALRSKYR